MLPLPKPDPRRKAKARNYVTRRCNRRGTISLLATLSCLIRRQYHSDVVHRLPPSSHGASGSGSSRGYHVFMGVQGALPGKGTNSGHNNLDSGNRWNSSSPPFSRRSAVLRDSFPCESEQQQQHQQQEAFRAHAALTRSSSPKEYLTANSFATENNITESKSSPYTLASSVSRGGAVSLNDDELDKMVEDLIAGLETGEKEGMCEDRDEEVGDNGSLDDVSLVNDQANLEKYDETKGDETNKQKIDRCAIKEAEEEDKSNDTEEETNTESPSFETLSKDEPSLSSSPSPRYNSSQTSNPKIPPYLKSTPTNAYYRFLVRRGPKGHILASFSLIAIQWIHLYLPALYRALATILLKLRIYNPQVLYERDLQRQRQRRYGPPAKKKGFASKLLFGTSSSSPKSSGVSKKARQQQQEQQQRADQEATSKLKQLYKTMKIGGTDSMSEVKHRYLSIGFMKRHGLGKDYQIENPRMFMGEVVGDGRERLSEDQRDKESLEQEDFVFSDDGLEEGQLGRLSSTTAEGTQQRQSAKRKAIAGCSNDWVVKAFSSSRHFGRPPPTNGNSDSSKASLPNHSLWETVKRSSILDAARKSYAEEQQATAQKRTNPATWGSSDSTNNLGNDPDKHDRNASVESAGNRSSNGASAMFQSVITRVGSGNGRIFGAYPNDAPPISACAHRRGVLQLARRYGYGDWKTEKVDYDEIEGASIDTDDCGGSKDCENLWGGGDMLLGRIDRDVSEGSEELITPLVRKQASKRKRRRRRKKTQPLK